MKNILQFKTMKYVLLGLLCMVSLSVVGQEGIEEMYAIRSIEDYSQSVIDGEYLDFNSTKYYWEIVDLHIPGNGGMDIDVRRSYAKHTDMELLAMESWILEVPRIKFTTHISAKTAGEISDNGLGLCHDPMSVDTRLSEYTQSKHSDFTGMSLIIPGETPKKLLFKLQSTELFPGDVKYVTQDNWVAKCSVTPNTNGKASAFEVTSPEGITYIFDKVGRRPNTFTSVGSRGEITVFATKKQDRFGNWLRYDYSDYVSPESEWSYRDDFKSEFTFSSLIVPYLTKITASDAREVNIVYDDLQYGKRVKEINYGEKKWKYRYTDREVKTYQGPYSGMSSFTVSPHLREVELPNGLKWEYEYDFIGTSHPYDMNTSRLDYFAVKGTMEDGIPALSQVEILNQISKVKSPTGVSISYEYLPCGYAPRPVPTVGEVPIPCGLNQGKRLFANVTPLVERTVSINGVSNTWYFRRMPVWPSTSAGPYNSYFGYDDYSQESKDLMGEGHAFSVVTMPDAEIHREFIDVLRDIQYSSSHGNIWRNSVILNEKIFVPGSTEIIQEKKYTWKKLPHRIGEDRIVHRSNDAGGILFSQEEGYYKVLDSLETLRDGQVYTTDYLDYSIFGSATKIRETGPSGVKYTKYDYTNDSVAWLVDLPASVFVSNSDENYTETVRMDYQSVSKDTFLDATDDQLLPYEEYRFGQLKQRYAGYHNDGSIKRIEYNVLMGNGSNRYIEFDDYKRGIAQTVKRPPRILTSENQESHIVESKVIDANGWLTSSTDANGTTTTYTYDAIGNVIAVDVENDPTYGNWLDTLNSWEYSNESGPIRTVTHCSLNNNRDTCLAGTTRLVTTEYYDNLLRLISVKHDDADNTSASGTRYRNYSYNEFSQKTFESFLSKDPDETQGTTYTYDALQRLDTVAKTGLGIVEMDYLSGNRIRTTDGENNVTVKTYQAFGSPTYELITKIESPESVDTDIDVNVFGLVEAVTQSGPGKTAGSTVTQTENHYYDQNKQLCLVTRNDVGGTAYSKNALGQNLWVASGQSASLTNCLQSQPTMAITYSYDNVGELAGINYPDNAPDVQYYRDDNGNVTLLTAGLVSHLYSYNTLNLLEDETFSIEGDESFFLDYGYDALGNRSSITYPDDSEVRFAPNAFGQPTQAVKQATAGGTGFTYASGAKYYPNGGIDRFTYGNGIAHKTTLNPAQLPIKLQDANLSTTALDYSYTYDNNLNITSLRDNTDTTFSLTNLAYDGLNRLTSTTGNAGIGSSTIRYDGLGNITYYQSKDSTLDYSYNTALNRLSGVSGTGSASKNYSSFSYDARGNITHNSHRGFTYNLANQMVSSGSNNYLYDGFNRRVREEDSKGTSYSFYNQEGSLLYRQTPEGGINYIYLGNRLIAKEGVLEGALPESSGKQHYRPYGSSIEGEIDDVGYTGHKFDKELGLSYMQARYYDPVIGRFYSNDPVSAIEQSSKGDPIHGFNRYSYANNSPYKFIDPDGRDASMLGVYVGARLSGKSHEEASEIMRSSINSRGNLAKETVSFTKGGMVVDVVETIAEAGKGENIKDNLAGMAAGETAGKVTEKIVEKKFGQKVAELFSAVVGKFTGDIVKNEVGKSNDAAQEKAVLIADPAPAHCVIEGNC